MAANWVDYLIVFVIGLSVITGLFRGLLKELIALTVWILAIWLAITYTPALDQMLQKYIQDNSARKVLSFVLILIATIIAGGLFNGILSLFLRRSGLSGTDRLLGMAFGFVRGIFLVALMILIVGMTSLVQQPQIRESSLYVKFIPIVTWLQGYMPEIMSRIPALPKSNTEMRLDTKDLKPKDSIPSV